MNPRRRRILGALAAAAAGVAQAQQRMNTAMHASASERLATLAERMGKCQVQVAQGLLADRARRLLRESEREFDVLLPAASALAADNEARDGFVMLRLLWKELRAWLQKPPTRENARQVGDRVDEVAWIAGKCARLLKTDGTSQREGLAAMQAATLAQRVARLHLGKRFDGANARRDTELMDSTARLGSVLRGLLGSPHTLDLEDDLRMANTQYDFMVTAMREHASAGAAAALETVAKTADHVTDSMERAARLYENGAA